MEKLILLEAMISDVRLELLKNLCQPFGKNWLATHKTQFLQFLFLLGASSDYQQSLLW
jgi:hypothetical protein